VIYIHLLCGEMRLHVGANLFVVCTFNLFTSFPCEREYRVKVSQVALGANILHLSRPLLCDWLFECLLRPPTRALLELSARMQRVVRPTVSVLPRLRLDMQADGCRDSAAPKSHRLSLRSRAASVTRPQGRVRSGPTHHPPTHQGQLKSPMGPIPPAMESFPTISL
jgi:hypothetical protein